MCYVYYITVSIHKWIDFFYNCFLELTMWCKACFWWFYPMLHLEFYSPYAIVFVKVFLFFVSCICASTINLSYLALFNLWNLDRLLKSALYDESVKFKQKHILALDQSTLRFCVAMTPIVWCCLTQALLYVGSLLGRVKVNKKEKRSLNDPPPEKTHCIFIRKTGICHVQY